jgi:hypothetical protein
MRNMTLASLGAAAAFCSGLAAAGSPDELPAAVAAGLGEVVAMCTDAGGKAQTREAIRRADLNGDGNEDYVLDVGSIGCEGAASIYGDREKGVTVYAGDGKGGARQVFSEFAYGTRLESTGSEAQLWLTVSGASCGKKSAEDFASESFCERPLAWNAKTQLFDYAPLSMVKMIE